MAEKKNKLKLTRRDFIKTSVAAGAGSSLLSMMNADVASAAWYNDPADPTKQKTSTCTYCSVGCGVLLDVNTAGTTVVDVKGDLTSPINKGSLCSKGQALVQLVNSSERLGIGTTKTIGGFDSDPKAFDCPVRMTTSGLNAGKWEGVSFDTALTDIATKMRDARGLSSDVTKYDSTTKQFTVAAKKKVAFFGSSHMNNEENYIYRKLIANFGTNNTEHQARI